MAAVQDEIWVVSLILFYAFYLSLAYHGFLGCFRGSFTHFICLLPIDRVSQRLSCQLYALYPSLACTVFCDVSEALTLALCTLLRFILCFIALPDCALRNRRESIAAFAHCPIVTLRTHLGQVAIHWDIDSGDQTHSELRGTH